MYLVAHVLHTDCQHSFNMAVTIPTCLRVVLCLKKARSCVLSVLLPSQPSGVHGQTIQSVGMVSKPQSRLRSVEWQGFFSSCVLAYLATTPCGLVVLSMFLRNILPTFHFNPEEGGVIFLRKLVSTYNSTQKTNMHTVLAVRTADRLGPLFALRAPRPRAAVHTQWCRRQGEGREASDEI